MKTQVLAVDDLSVDFVSRAGSNRAVDHVSFELRAGEAVALVGESGSGKSTLAMAVMGLLPPSTEVSIGSLRVGDTELKNPAARDLERFRGTDIAVVFQDPLTSLNPVLTIGKQLTEPLRYHRHMSRTAARARAIELLEAVGIGDAANRLSSYPHEFSGGMRQRVVIAMALAAEPKILIADEPTTALDATVQAEIVELISGLRRDLGLAVLWITHDLALMSGFADRVMVMYGGKIVESASTVDLYERPEHPYTQALLRSAPTMSLDRDKRLWSLDGAPPQSALAIQGCSFRPRCWNAVAACLEVPPLAPRDDPDHLFACWNPQPMPADSVDPTEHSHVGVAHVAG